MPTTPAQLQSMSIPGVVRFDAGNGGLRRAVITTDLAEAEVYLHGAHVTRFQRRGQQPVLWISDKSYYSPDKPIRGGVPLVFPWFGPAPAGPAHGFARLREWEVESVLQPGDGSVEIIFTLNADEQTRQLWPHEFALRYHVRVSNVLELVLRVRNDGQEAITFEEALHTYLSVGDVRKVSVSGLEGTTYVDKVDGAKHKPQGSDPITLTAETDRIYTKTRATCVLHDPSIGRRINIAKEGSDATVIWNPWIGKARAMADFGDEEWPAMLCIETCNVGDERVNLAPGKTHEMRAAIGAL